MDFFTTKKTKQVKVCSCITDIKRLKLLRKLRIAQRVKDLQKMRKEYEINGKISEITAGIAEANLWVYEQM